MKKNDIGLIGLAVMGRSLALNMADHGYEVAGYNRTYKVTEQMAQKWPHEHFHGYQSLQEMINSLKSPRVIMLMVKAGNIVDDMIEQLIPLLDKEDMILDGGNSFFKDTIRREIYLKEKGIYYFGVGVSGGEAGARFGPSIMPGGDKEAYHNIQGILECIAARADDGSACCTYIGENGAGHYVKMVHNGIEYADMQMISEAYLLLKHVAHLSNAEIADVFKTFNEGELNSYLINITSKIFMEKDDQGDGELIDKIKDASAQKGTGKWTSEEAIHLDVNVSMITASYQARLMSNNANRQAVQDRYTRNSMDQTIPKDAFVKQVKEGLYAAKMIAYAQGFDLMKEAAEQYGWCLDFGKIASIFRAGCIIQARFLNEISKAYQKDENLSHLLLDDFFANHIQQNEESLRAIVIQAVSHGIPVPSLSNAISYLDSLQASHVGANLIQAQRDFFGAHTFERNDTEGSFHHKWGEKDA